MKKMRVACCVAVACVVAVVSHVRAQSSLRDLVNELTASADAVREAHGQATAPQRIKEIFALASKSAEDDCNINFCGFFTGMSRHDADALAEYYKLASSDYYFQSDGEKAVWNIHLSLKGLRRVMKGGNTFKELAQAVANRVGDMECRGNILSGESFFERKTIDGVVVRMSDPEGFTLQQENVKSKMPIETIKAKSIRIAAEEVESVRKTLEQTFERGVSFAKGEGVAQDMTEAVKWYRMAAEQGYAPAQNELGSCYYKGHGVAQDMEEAVKWFRMAAEQGYTPAQNELGSCYYRGHGVAQDMEEAVKWFRMAAERGEVAAQNALGVCYERGNGVACDLSEAVKWYRMAAERGNAKAQANLGCCCFVGRGVAKSDKEAVKWLNKSAWNGDTRGQFLFGCYWKKVYNDDKLAVKWYRESAEQGYAPAQYMLGLCYENGNRVVQKNLAEAINWYRKAAEQGHVKAQSNLGMLLIDRDNEEAVRWLRKAATQENAKGMKYLGFCYDYGKGVTQDREEAMKWYRKAEEKKKADTQGESDTP